MTPQNSENRKKSIFFNISKNANDNFFEKSGKYFLYLIGYISRGNNGKWMRHGLILFINRRSNDTFLREQTIQSISKLLFMNSHE